MSDQFSGTAGGGGNAAAISSFSAPASTFFDDFIGESVITTGAIGAASGNSAIIGSSAGPDANHPGTIQLISGTGASGTGEYAQPQGTYNLTNLNTGPYWALETALTLSTLTNAKYRFGVLNTVNANPPTDGYWFVYDSAVDTHWHCKTAASSVTTDIDSGVVAVASAWHIFKIEGDSTSIRFFIDGVLVGTSTTNLTSGALRIAWQTLNNSTTSCTLYADYIKWLRAVTR